jgi:hypothetical protein
VDRWIGAGSTISAIADAQQSESFSWSSPVSRGNLVRIRNVRGDVSVIPTASRDVEVIGEKQWRRGNPRAVRIDARRVGESVLICVLPGATRDCESPVTAANSPLVGDVVVHLSVKVPRGMRLTVTTINGDVSIETESRVLVAESVNGNVVVRSSEGSVVASGAAGASS